MNRGGWTLLGALAAGGVVAGIVAVVAGRRTDEPSDDGYQAPFTTRNPSSILAAVAYVDPERNATLQNGYLGQPNWCNRFTHLVADYLHVPLIWGEYGTRANDMIEWLGDGNEGWFPAGSGAEAQQLAMQGFFVLATYRNILPWESGHMAVVLPYPGAVQIAQAGKHNFNHGLVSDGFGSIQPVYFAHA